MISKKINGFSLVEILISMGVIAIVMGTVSSVYVVTQQASRISSNSLKAHFLAREYIEEVKNIRSADWDNLINGKYEIQRTGGNLSLVGTTEGEAVENFKRFVEISDVYRDSNGNLLDAPGLIDPASKKIAVTVSWTSMPSGSITDHVILTRYRDNLAWTQSSKADFEAGTHNGTTTIDSAGGEVVLGAGGQSDWCDPNLSIAALDLPKSGVASAITAIQGRAFAGTGDNSAGVSFVNVNLSDTDPPAASILGTIDGYKTNDIFGEQNYGYISTDTNSEEVAIVSIASNPYSKIGYFNIPGNTDGEAIFVVGDVGYVMGDSKLWTFNLSSKTGSRAALDSDGISVGGTGTSVYVVGNYAYITTASSPNFRIIDISNPASLVQVGSATLGSAGGKDVYVNDSATRAYVAITNNAGPELYIVDIESKTGVRPVVSTYDTNGMNPHGIEVVPGGRAIVVGTGSEEYQVIDISDENNPTYCGGLQIDAGVFDSASVLESDSDAYTYIVTGDTSEELKIIEGGPGGSVAMSGVFESQTLDTGFNSTGFNRFDVSFDEPTQTEIKFQVSAVEPGPGGCVDADFNDFNFVGPSGAGSFFMESDFIPTNNDNLGYENPSQCFRLRAYLETTDVSRTPTLYDFTINYSP